MGREFLFDFDGFQFLGLVVFRVLPRPECQLAGLASPRASVRAYLSDGEAGVTLVVFLASSLQSRWISTTLGFALIWATAGLVKLSPICSGLFSKSWRFPEFLTLQGLREGHHISHISEV